MTFPTNLSNYTGSETLLVAEHAQEHNALEAKVGIDGSAVTTSHDYKLSGVTGTDKAVSKTGIETLTNKTLTSPVINTPTGDVATITGAQTLKNKIINTKSSDGNVFKLNNNTLISPSDEDGEYIFPTANATLVGTSETQTLSNKTLTSPVINTSFSGTAKATAAEVAAGTEDAKIVTPLAAAPYGNSSMARQAIINGNFDVWQRLTSKTNCSTKSYIADRWEAYSANTAATWSQQTASLNGSKYSMRVQRTASNSATNAIYLNYTMESVDSMKFRGKHVTLSFQCKVGANYSPTSSLLNIQLVTGTGTDENVTNGFTGGAVKINENKTVTTSWANYSITTSTVMADTINQIGFQFLMNPTGTAGAADYFEITQVQLCAGDVALPFQPKSFEEELQDCLRYYEKDFNIATTPGNNVESSTPTFVAGKVDANGFFQCSTIFYKVKKRISTPVITYYASTTGQDGKWAYSAGTSAIAYDTPTTQGSNENGFSFYIGSLTNGQAVFSYGHWTADAEF